MEAEKRRESFSKSASSPRRLRTSGAFLAGCQISLCECGVSEITIHSLRSNWHGARREGGSVSPAILDRLSNEAPGQFQRNPQGGLSFGRMRCCSLLTDPLRDMLVARAWPPPKIHCRECIVISEIPHSQHPMFAERGHPRGPDACSRCLRCLVSWRGLRTQLLQPGAIIGLSNRRFAPRFRR